jgi:hypothetical protein
MWLIADGCRQVGDEAFIRVYSASSTWESMIPDRRHAIRSLACNCWQGMTTSFQQVLRAGLMVEFQMLQLYSITSIAQD